MPSKATTTLKNVKPLKRTSTGIPEIDAVLGGGLVPGHTVRVTGPLGIGKTTLLLQMADGLTKGGKKVLYVSGEMRADDVLEYARRLGIVNENIEVLHDNGDEGAYAIVKYALKIKAVAIVVDSLHTSFCEDVESDVGTPTQMSAVANYYTSFAKEEKIAVVVIGHLNRDGSAAGPANIDHIFDTLVNVYFDADGVSPTKRLISVDKNRFGRDDVTALMEMTITGLRSSPKKPKLIVEN